MSARSTTSPPKVGPRICVQVAPPSSERHVPIPKADAYIAAPFEGSSSKSVAPYNEHGAKNVSKIVSHCAPVAPPSHRNVKFAPPSVDFHTP